MVEELGDCWCLQRVVLRRGTVLVTAAQVATASLCLLSQLVGVGGVLLWVCLFCSGCVRVVVSASTRYVHFSSKMTVQFLLFFKIIRLFRHVPTYRC
jgi:hypothetical protein